MGKPMTKEAYGNARRQLSTCPSVDTCTNANPKLLGGGFCHPCRNARKLVKAYERASRR